MQITEAEWEVMESVWQAKRQLPADILGRLPSGKRSHRTFRTLLSRLVEKGAVSVEVEGSRHFYTAAVTRKACIKVASSSFAHRFFHGDIKEMLLHFVTTESLSSEELEELRNDLANLAKQQKNGGKP